MNKNVKNRQCSGRSMIEMLGLWRLRKIQAQTAIMSAAKLLQNIITFILAANLIIGAKSQKNVQFVQRKYVI